MILLSVLHVWRNLLVAADTSVFSDQSLVDMLAFNKRQNSSTKTNLIDFSSDNVLYLRRFL